MQLREELKALRALLKKNSDGCSASPDLWWYKCCQYHDACYGLGIVKREVCDKRFLNCLKKNSKTFFGKWFLSYWYYFAVRLMGKRHYGNARIHKNHLGTSESSSNTNSVLDSQSGKDANHPDDLQRDP